jgi:hypothetical protein
MDRKASIVVATAATAVFLAFGAFFVLRDAAPHERNAPVSRTVIALPSNAEPALVARPRPATRRSPSAASAPVPTERDGSGLDEAALMATLRKLRGSDPTLTLQLAREGNQRFRNSGDAAERSWFIVKALSDLGRHDEARLEGRALVEEYRDTRWAQDVYRHLSVNPPTHPFERGYGKKLESDP